jgi:hypothetical protein
VKLVLKQTEIIEKEKRQNFNLTAEETLLLKNEQYFNDIRSSYKCCSFKKKGNVLGCIQTNCVGKDKEPSIDLAMKLIKECRGINSTKSSEEVDNFFIEVNKNF